MDAIQRHIATKEVYSIGTGSNGEKKSQLDHTERKSVGWIEGLINQFSNLGELVVDPFNGTFVMARAF